MQAPKPAPQAAKKKKKKSWQAKTTSKGLEGFVNWTNPAVGESSTKKEAEMSCLVTGFSMRMRKRAANAQEEAILGLEVSRGKRFRPSGFDEEV